MSGTMSGAAMRRFPTTWLRTLLSLLAIALVVGDTVRVAAQAPSREPVEIELDDASVQRFVASAADFADTIEAFARAMQQLGPAPAPEAAAALSRRHTDVVAALATRHGFASLTAFGDTLHTIALYLGCLDAVQVPCAERQALRHQAANVEILRRHRPAIDAAMARISPKAATKTSP